MQAVIVEAISLMRLAWTYPLHGVRVQRVRWQLPLRREVEALRYGACEAREQRLDGLHNLPELRPKRPSECPMHREFHPPAPVGIVVWMDGPLSFFRVHVGAP